MKKWFAALFVFYTQAFAVDLFHHEIKEYPKGVGCELTAKIISEQFVKQTGFEIYWAGVTKESIASCDVKISYLADAALPFTKSVDTSGTGSVNRGVYSTLKACEEKLSREAQLMQEATGLNAWLSYCYRDERFQDRYPFVPVVEAIGVGKNGFFASDTLLLVTPNNGWQPVIEEIAKTSSRVGVLPVTVVLRPYIIATDRQMTLRYYAKERLSLSDENHGRHTDPQICEQQLASVREGLLKAMVPPVAAYCGKYGSKDYRLALIGLSKNIFGVGNLQTSVDPKGFPTLEACLNSIPGTLQFYREKLQKNALTAFCANGNGPFQATVFVEKTSAR